MAARRRCRPADSLWIFKGGTCVKKCFFETYRFSEDLDFSLRPDAPYTQDELVAQLRELTAHVAELTGLEFPADLVDVKTRQNKQGLPTFEGRVAYRGPLEYPGSPKIRFDITRHEPVIDDPAERPILHPYPDALPEGVAVLTYSFEELLAEKTRALLERSRPRDLYDVVHLLENAPTDLNLVDVRRLFAKKCAGKAIALPSSIELIGIVAGDAELRSEWASMLAHQLPALPDLDAMLSRLPAVLGWLDAPSKPLPETQLPRVPVGEGLSPIVAPGIRYWGAGSPLESIRFAATNRLMLEFEYHGKHRQVEPYSVRRAGTGNVLLYAWELADGHMKAYKVDEMSAVKAMSATFSPRYQVEISAYGPIQASSTAAHPRITTPRQPRPHSARRGPTYIFQCSYCGKRFEHSTNDSALREHKTQSGWKCSGRRGYLVDARY
ncbi:MAG TPA: nucleotidyl transferase AbiEii/AbiGii toxin family protein [Vicinamibacterales bacterium]|nr:nucleotidyl transferase AbiEii/AbiGii toxin family protein [Vicinamibacterales bacterium]